MEEIPILLQTNPWHPKKDPQNINRQQAYKKTMNKYMNLHKKNKIQKLREMHTKNPKSYWKYLITIKTAHDKPQSILKSLYEHFQTVNASNEPKEHFTATHKTGLGSDLNTRITRQEINKCITNLKNGKAAGDDKILNECIKSTKEIFLPVYDKTL